MYRGSGKGENRNMPVERLLSVSNFGSPAETPSVGKFYFRACGLLRTTLKARTLLFDESRRRHISTLSMRFAFILVRTLLHDFATVVEPPSLPPSCYPAHDPNTWMEICSLQRLTMVALCLALSILTAFAGSLPAHAPWTCTPLVSKYSSLDVFYSGKQKDKDDKMLERIFRIRKRTWTEW